MAENGAIGILLPVTQNILKLKVAPARNMIDSQVPVAYELTSVQMPGACRCH
jgi:hypothetical protein